MKGSFVQIAAFAKTTGMEASDALELSDRAMQAVADSAAFYDRSLEDVTDSLQSFLKGNFENDAALGLSCTETTRNTAANALYGKSFKDLAEEQKQLTLLQMVEDANKASGALGQAARESDTWTNQLGNLKQSLKDLKAAAGQGILGPAVKGLKILNVITQKATETVSELTGKTGMLTEGFDWFHAKMKRFQPAMDRTAQTLSRGMGKGMDAVRGIVNKLGGMENVLKILAVAAASFGAVMTFAKIIISAKKFVAAIKAIDKAMVLAKLKVWAIVAAIVILTLIIDDLINFLKGNDSVIGALFDKLGIGAEDARKAIFGAFERVKDFLLGIWDFLKTAAGMWADTVSGFFERHGESIRENFERVGGIIKTFLKGAWSLLSQVAAILFGETEDHIGSSALSTKDMLLSIWQAVLNTLSAIWNALYSYASVVFNILAEAIETIFGWIQTFWSNWGSRILAWFQILWDGMGRHLNDFLKVVEGVADFIASVFSGDWQGAWDAVRQIFVSVWDAVISTVTVGWELLKLLFSMALSAIQEVWNAAWAAIADFLKMIWDSIVSFVSGMLNSISGEIMRISDLIIGGIQSAIDFITSLPEKAVQWGADFIHGLISGITGAVGGIGEAVKGVADTISSYLHFSVPDQGPLTNYESWMPDFMAGLARGIQSNEGMVLDKVRNFADGMASLTQAATANVATAANSTVSNLTSNMTQNVNINNSYTGGTPEAQKNVSRAMKKSAEDATAYMARGLAYARG